MKQKLPSFDVRGKKVLILGLGLHGGGAAAVQWCAKHGAIIRVTDLKTKLELAPTLKQLKNIKASWHFGGHHADDFHWADIIIQNPAVPDSLPELRLAGRHGRVIVNEATIFFQRCLAPIIAITGTRGKSTTTTLIGQLMRTTAGRVFVAGNIRYTSMLEILDRVKANDLVVLELSSFQLERLPDVRISPHVAVLLNIKVDHLNRYASMPVYAAAKYNLLRYQRPNDFTVLNADSPWTRSAARLTAGQVVWFSTQRPVGPWSIFYRRGWIWEKRQRVQHRIIKRRDLPLPGHHQLENLLAAVAVARINGVSNIKIRQVVRAFRGVPDRQELIRTWRGHRFINDTTATTPDGTLAAVEVFPQAVFIVGGTDKRLVFGRLAQVLYRRRRPLVFLPGTATIKLLHALRRCGDHRAHAPVKTMSAAVQQAVAVAKPGQAIVLSPGAASFGLFKHEFDRGEQFRRAVRRLR